MSTITDFLSRDCKLNEHTNCHGQWSGLGVHVLCHCKCHNKKDAALVRVEGLDAKASSSCSHPGGISK
jgi:hypothetical protein